MDPFGWTPGVFNRASDAASNTAVTSISPSRASVGLSGTSDIQLGVGGDSAGIHGKISLGIIEGMILGLVLFYIYTRNVQGG